MGVDHPLSQLGGGRTPVFFGAFTPLSGELELEDR
jgi:hypothetical protein